MLARSTASRISLPCIYIRQPLPCSVTRVGHQEGTNLPLALKPSVRHILRHIHSCGPALPGTRHTRRHLPVATDCGLPQDMPFHCRRRRASLFVLVACVVLLAPFCLDGELRDRFLDSHVRPAWFRLIGLTRYDFRPTPDDQACLDGTAVRINVPGMPSAIPNVVHFITGVDRPNPAGLMLWLAVRAADANLPGSEIHLHYVHLSTDGPWWPDVQDRVTLRHHEPSFLDDFAHLTPPPSA